jgi:CRISPR/Cas system-associated exonuclease Cas4 (RecB family)
MSYRGPYKKESEEPYKISRSGIESFVKCPRCFYLDKKLGVKQPAGFPFNLNSAVDHLLKKEFDIHREKGTPHPMMKHYGIDAIPFSHKDMNIWRENFKGIQYLDKKNNFLVTGAVDDVWVNKNGELIVVDYKSTSKEGKISIDADWQNSYKRQMEIYEWLLRKNNFKVSDTGYFVYCNGKKDKEAFDGKLEFDIDLIPYKGSDAWIEPEISKIKKLLDGNKIPGFTETCDYCKYQQELREIK